MRSIWGPLGLPDLGPSGAPMEFSFRVPGFLQHIDGSKHSVRPALMAIRYGLCSTAKHSSTAWLLQPSLQRYILIILKTPIGVSHAIVV